MRCVLRAKIRISEGRSKRRLDYAEREYLRRQPKIRISGGNVEFIRTERRASAQPKSEKQGTETNDRFGSAGARRPGYSRRGGKRGAKGNSLASFCEMRLRESSPDPFDRCAERGCAVRRTAEVPVNAGERPSAARGGAFLPAAFGDAGRSTRNIVGMFWRKKPASRIVPAEIDSVGSAGSCTRRNPTLFSRNARRRFE